MTAALSCDDPVDPGPPVSTVQVAPSAGFLDLADTLRLTATAASSNGEELIGVELTWRSVSGNATVDESGLVTGVAPGEAVIEAEAWNGVVGAATIRITPIMEISPDTGRYGQLITLSGTGLPTNAAVRFTGETGRVSAVTRSATPDALEVWVPVGAVDGPIELTWPGDSVVTSHSFGLTAERDVYASLDGPADVTFPFHNPALLGTSGAPHELRFTLDAPSPFALHLADRGPAYEDVAARFWLFRTDTQPATLVSFGMTRDQLDRSAMLDSVAYSRSELPAGDYTLLIAALDLTSEANPDARRAFGIRLSTTPSFGLDPDDHEPDDYPAEAPVVTLPFDAVGRRAENPYAMDHYTFDVSGESTITVSASADDPLLLLFLMADGQPDILAAWDAGQVLAESAGELSSQQIQATVPAGRYTALVWDWGGRARSYDIGITAAATGADPAGAMAEPLSGDAATARSPARAAVTMPARRRP